MYYFELFSAKVSSYFLIVIYTFLLFCTSFAVPAWTSLMKDIIFENRAQYFAERNRVNTTMLFIGMLSAGFLLDYFKNTHVFVGFILLFFIASVAKIINTFLFLRHYEPKYEYDESSHFTFRQFLRKMHSNNFGRFVLMMTGINFAIQVSAPFYAVYMLKDLGFSYIQFTIISSVSALVLIIFPFWGRFIDKYGSYQTMKYSGIFIPIAPFGWFFIAISFKVIPAHDYPVFIYY